MDVSYHCDTCGHTGCIPRSFLMNKKLPGPWNILRPIAGRINDEFLFVQFNHSVMIMDYDQAAELANQLTVLLLKPEETDGQDHTDTP